VRAPLPRTLSCCSEQRQASSTCMQKWGAGALLPISHYLWHVMQHTGSASQATVCSKQAQPAIPEWQRTPSLSESETVVLVISSSQGQSGAPCGFAQAARAVPRPCGCMPSYEDRRVVCGRELAQLVIRVHVCRTRARWHSPRRGQGAARMCFARQAVRAAEHHRAGRAACAKPRIVMSTSRRTLLAVYGKCAACMLRWREGWLVRRRTKRVAEAGAVELGDLVGRVHRAHKLDE